MKRSILAFLMVLGMLTTVFAQEAVDVKGAWNMTLETPQGAVPISLTFSAVEGEKITGTLSSPQGDMNLTGTVTASAINFSATYEGNGRSLTLTFTGKLSKEGMTGEVDFGGMGQGNWSAKRPG